MKCTAAEQGSKGVGLLRQGTIGADIRNRANAQADRTAVMSSSFGSVSYRELQGLIDSVRATLRQTGFGRSARIAVAMANGAQAALAIVAVSCSAVSIPLNPRQTLREIGICLASLRPDAILLMKDSDSAVRQAAQDGGLTIFEAIPTRECALIFSLVHTQTKTTTVPDEPDEPEPDAPAFILQTSGTVAEPKFIPFSHRNMLAAACRLQSWFELSRQDRCLSVSPPFYSHGLKVTVFTPLLTGGTILFPEDASKFDYAEWFVHLAPTWYSAGPTLHRLIFDHAQSREGEKKDHSLRFILSGGAPLPRSVLEGLQDALGVPTVEHYGSSEAAQIAANLPSPGRSKLGTCGVPWPGTIKIVGEDGHPVSPGEHGEILVGGPTLTSGYLNAPELNRTSFINGWFKSGDIGSIDKDGFLVLHGRKNDLINRGSEKISPSEIDEALMRHPAVAEAAAFSIPHQRLGEDVAGAVVLRTGMTVTSVELRRYLHDQLAPFKVPRRIVFCEQLPKGKTGKVLRRQLCESFGERAQAESRAVTSQSRESSVADSNILIQLTELWERLLRISPVSLDDDFSEKGGDSLLAMEMLSELERLLGKTIPSSILFEARSIRQLAHKLHELSNIRSKALIRINASGTLPPLIFFHGDFLGGGLYTAKLASLLGSDQPLFVIAPPGHDAEPIPQSIEAMAAIRMPLIREAQPKGPYFLCGYCNGGMVAFEVARMLISAGENVEMVGMIDPPGVSAKRSFQLFLSVMHFMQPLMGQFVDNLVTWTWYKLEGIEKLSMLSPKERWARIMYKVRKRLAIGDNQEVAVPQTSDKQSRIGPEDVVLAMSTYSPKPVAVQVVQFSAEYGSVAWGRISSDVEIIRMVGNHSDVVLDPANLATIAHHLQTRLRTSK